MIIEMRVLVKVKKPPVKLIIIRAGIVLCKMGGRCPGP
jgi:hypothetical protein